MSNDFYNASGQPGDHAPGASAAIRSEYQALAAAFDKMPALSVANAGFFTRVNVSGTALESVDGGTVFVKSDGSGLMTGRLRIKSAGEGARLIDDGGFLAGYNTAETVRTGYLQFNAGGFTLLRADTGAAAGVALQTAGGSLQLDQAGVMTLSGTTLLFNTATATRMRITSTGLVGIARVPTSKTLEVQGGILSGVTDNEALRIVNSNGYASFWDSGNTTRTGYLLGVAPDLLLMADVGSLVFGAGGIVRGSLTSDGRAFFNGIHNNAAGAAGTVPMLASGTWTPSITNVSSVAAAVPRLCLWMRVGNAIHCSGSVLITPSTPSTSVAILASLPIAVDIVDADELAGTVAATDTSNGSMAGPVVGNVANNAAGMRLQNTALTSPSEWSFTFSYRMH